MFNWLKNKIDSMLGNGRSPEPPPKSTFGTEAERVRDVDDKKREMDREEAKGGMRGG
jgi:hypothetical protein